MASRNKSFVDDGWAVWVEGDNDSTVYINDWFNPKGKSYVDFAIKIRGVKSSKSLNFYIPFLVEQEEIIDLSHALKEEANFRATFNNVGIIDCMKNEYTSEVAYNGKTLDIVHYPINEFELSQFSKGTLVKCNIEKIQNFIDNEDAYFFIRFPHKTIDLVFKPEASVSTFLTRFRDLIMSPVISESYVYQIRINESRMLPQEINKIGAFHRQKLKKAVVSLAISEEYEVNDRNCYRIRRLEEDLYKNLVPEGFNLENVIYYLWQEDREDNYLGKFNFYLHVSRNKIGRASMFLYMVLLILVGILGDFVWDSIKSIFNLFQ
jgi:hypothetical protein